MQKSVSNDLNSVSLDRIDQVNGAALRNALRAIKAQRTNTAARSVTQFNSHVQVSSPPSGDVRFVAPL
jgi:hypothetical protein